METISYILTLCLTIGCIFLSATLSSASPTEAKANRIRRSGFSDQTLAKYETMLALGNPKSGLTSNHFGIIDPSLFIKKRSGFSDQKLAQMQTQMALGQMDGLAGFNGNFGLFDPNLMHKRLNELFKRREERDVKNQRLLDQDKNSRKSMY